MSDDVAIPRKTVTEIIGRLERVLLLLKGERVTATCSVCKFWSGSCGKGKINRTAAEEACELFEPRGV